MKRFFLRLLASLRVGRAERELAREVHSHLALLEEDFRRRGMSPEEARLAARRAFGGIEQTKEIQRDARSFRWLDDARRDVGYAVRSLRKTPAFALTALVTITLGFAANLAIFSVVNAVMLKTLDVRDPSRLVFLNVMRAGGRVGNAPPYPCYEIVRDTSKSFSSLAAFTFDLMTFTIDGRAEKVLGQVASGSFHDLLGVRPALGRLLVAADDADPSVAVLGYRYWQRRFGGDPGVLGRTIVYENHPLLIVGVTQPGFDGLAPGWTMDITVPFTIAGDAALTERGRWWFSVVARLKPGVSHRQAAAEIDPLFQAYMTENAASPDERKRFVNLTVTSASRGDRSLREQFSEPLLLLTGIAAIVLFIACANVANLLLARSASRRHEFATRVAIGASRGRLVRQVMAESLLLGVTGILLGSALARWLVPAIIGPLARGPYPILLDVGPDYRVVCYAAAITLVTSLLFGLAPALRAGGAEPVNDLKHGGRPVYRSLGGVGQPSRPWHRLIPTSGATLVVGQIALSLVLLVVMGLLVGTLARLEAVDAGFRARDVAILDVELVDQERRRDDVPSTWMTILGRVQAVPGVESASLSWLTPLSMRNRGVAIQIVGGDSQLSRSHGIALNHVSPDYFETMGIAVRRGRAFTAHDDRGAPMVALLNETAARQLFGDRSPLGQRVTLFRREYEIVGVVADSKHQSLREEIPRFLYLPILQPVDGLSGLMLSVRPSPRSPGVVDAIRQELGRSGTSVVVGHASSLREQIDQSLISERLMSTLSGGFGVLGLGLSAVGLFSVMSFGVVRRMREIAVRMALGAPASTVRWQVLRESLRLAAVGLAIGVPLSLAAARALTSVLFGLDPADPMVLTGSCAVTVAVAGLAGFLPARRASRVDPMTVLRAE